jgi:uncharacterized protein (DUF1330 family)
MPVYFFRSWFGVAASQSTQRPVRFKPITFKGITMSAYVVMTRARTTNEAELEAYRSKGPQTLEGRPVKPIAFYGPLELLDGEPIEAAAILEFPSAKEARDWYESDAYEEARAHRLKGGDYQVFIVDGID